MKEHSDTKAEDAVVTRGSKNGFKKIEIQEAKRFHCR